jgi:K319-like protein
MIAATVDAANACQTEFENLMIRISRPIRSALLSILLVSLAACGGSGGGNGGAAGPVNTAPTARAGIDQSVVENVTVQLSGSGSDQNVGDTLTFAWTQTSGTGVTINNPGLAQASFLAPDVAPNVPETLSFRLTVTDAGGLSATDDIDVTVSEAAPVVTISGLLQYEFPTPKAMCDGLNFVPSNVRPIRGATVQLVDANGGAVLDSMVSGGDGSYSFQADGQTSVFVRVRAELKRSGSPSWDVEVRDNTANTTAALDQRPLYVLDGPAGNPNGADEVRNLLATHGWTGTSFAGTRSAAPFSVLDTIYSAMQLVLTADGQANFIPLDAFWSVNNSPTQGTGTIDDNISIGEIGTSFYRGDINSLFLLGKDGDDIEEFDDHVIAHEWGHYFEDNFSRSDSIGGQHSLNDRLDPRVAFGEGFATALSGMALDNPLYCDTFWSQGTLRGFDIQIESEPSGGFAGWFAESSVLKILYDLWDTNVDGVDSSSIGFAPIFEVLTGPQSANAAFTTIFSFAEAIKAAGTNQNPFIDALLTDENIVAAGIDKWGSTETNNPGSADALPVYTTIVPNGTPVNICSNSEFDSIGPNATGNKLNQHRFLRMTITTQQRYTFDIRADAATLALLPPDDPADDRDQSDPDMLYFLNGQIRNLVVSGGTEGISGVANVENFTSFNPIPVGEYVIDFNDWRTEDTETAVSYPARTCFDFTVTPAP